MKFTASHPAIIFLYLIGAFAGTILFRHPVFLGISLFSGCILTVCLRGKKALLPNLLCLLAGLLWSLWYGSFHHFGATILSYTRIGNAITLESILYAGMTGLQITAVLIWLSILHEMVTTDMVVYLFGRISPGLGLFISRLFRMLPRTGRQAEKMREARSGIGADNSAADRIRSRLKEWAMLFTWTSENLIEAGDSMHSRGYGAGERTAYALYRFDNRDRGTVLVLMGILVLLSVGYSLDQMQMLFDPRIMLNRITPLSFFFYTAYGLFLLWPLLYSVK